MILQDKDLTKLLIKCDCGCSGLEFSKLEFNKETEYFIYHTVYSFAAEQVTTFQKFKKRIKMAWNILFKGTHRYNELVLTETDFKELKEIVSKF